MKNKPLMLIVILTALSIVLMGGKSNDSHSLDAHYDKNLGKYVFRFAHEEIDGSVQDYYVKEFSRLMEEKSNGEVKIEMYPVNQIGDATQQTELLQNGGIDFAIVSPGNTGTIVPENQIFSLHFLFSDDMEKNMEIFSNSKALNELLSKKYEEKNLKVLSYWTEGFMEWTSNKKLQSPEDFKGFKMRIMPSPLTIASYEAYGASPTPTPYMEVYSGLQLKMLDGQENPLFAIEEMKFGEVQKYLIFSEASLYVTTTCVNPDFFNSLPEKYQNMILETVDELRDYSYEIQNELNEEALEKIKKNDNLEFITITSEEREQFKNASESARKKYTQLTGEEGKNILNLLEKEVDEIEEK